MRNRSNNGRPEGSQTTPKAETNPARARNEYGESIQAEAKKRSRRSAKPAAVEGAEGAPGTAKTSAPKPRRQAPKRTTSEVGVQKSETLQEKPAPRAPRGRKRVDPPAAEAAASAEPKELQPPQKSRTGSPTRRAPRAANAPQAATQKSQDTRRRRAPKDTKPVQDGTVHHRGPVVRMVRNQEGHNEELIIQNNSDKDAVRVIPLGGLDEIGKNMTVIEYREEMIIVDCGLKFPEDEMLGIDIVIPDVTFLEDNLKRIKGFFITHGHEDHIGALPYILKKINVPVYATQLTLGLIEIKLREHGLFDKVRLHVVKPKDVINLSHMKVEFIKTNHSIPDACALAIHTPAGMLIHTGDFKIDLTPVDGDVIDLARFAELGTQGVLGLLAESTNAERPGYTQSERTIGRNFEKIFLGAKGRIIVATFSSNVHRLQQIAQAAVKMGRKCCFTGRSMENVVGVARELGYLSIEDRHIISVDDIKRFRDDQLCIMTTGSQGEPMSALTRMSMGEHRRIKIQPGDTVILSSHPIPGNEKSVSRTINYLYKLGAEVIYEAIEDVHVSGHACQEELKLIHALVKPKYFIPVHGEYRHQKVHSELAQTMGIAKENIIIPSNGDVIDLSQEKGIRTLGRVRSGQVLVDGSGVGDVGNVVLRDRKHLSEDGILTVVATIDSESGVLIAGPDIISRGFVYLKEAEGLLENARRMVQRLLIEAEGDRFKSVDFLKNNIKEELKNFLYQRTKRKPMILPVIMEI
ncbi:Ribonuclease J2 (endoribonuclease in RNA processing) [Clostridiaceae bacterium JG1575]|nr:Ribonuclease J2 (endoribonuclease in RNA processing) [Clostridiaceae bacterium JG1575]